MKMIGIDCKTQLEIWSHRKKNWKIFFNIPKKERVTYFNWARYPSVQFLHFFVATCMQPVSTFLFQQHPMFKFFKSILSYKPFIKKRWNLCWKFHTPANSAGLVFFATQFFYYLKHFSAWKTSKIRFQPAFGVCSAQMLVKIYNTQ